MKQMVEIYIRLAEMETKREVKCFYIFHIHSFFFPSIYLKLFLSIGLPSNLENFIFHSLLIGLFMQDTNKKVTLPRDLRNLPVLELVSSLLNFYVIMKLSGWCNDWWFFGDLAVWKNNSYIDCLPKMVIFPIIFLVWVTF